MRLYFCEACTVDAHYIIRAENEWQARDIADGLDHERREWEAELHAEFCGHDHGPTTRKPYYMLGNGVMSEFKTDGDAGECFTVYPEPWY